MQALTREQFLETETGAFVEKELQRMANSAAHETITAFDSGTGGDLGFVDRHINYLVKHPRVGANVYLSNLRIMTRAKR